MRCAICDKDSDTITFDRVDKTFSPCAECQEVIQDCIDGYNNFDEDEFYDDDDIEADVGC